MHKSRSNPGKTRWPRDHTTWCFEGAKAFTICSGGKKYRAFSRYLWARRKRTRFLSRLRQELKTPRRVNYGNLMECTFCLNQRVSFSCDNLSCEWLVFVCSMRDYFLVMDSGLNKHPLGVSLAFELIDKQRSLIVIFKLKNDQDLSVLSGSG